jgi:hypothetical protein
VLLPARYSLLLALLRPWTAAPAQRAPTVAGIEGTGNEGPSLPPACSSEAYTVRTALEVLLRSRARVSSRARGAARI